MAPTRGYFVFPAVLYVPHRMLPPLEHACMYCPVGICYGCVYRCATCALAQRTGRVVVFPPCAHFVACTASCTALDVRCPQLTPFPPKPRISPKTVNSCRRNGRENKLSGKISISRAFPHTYGRFHTGPFSPLGRKDSPSGSCILFSGATEADSTADLCMLAVNGSILDCDAREMYLAVYQLHRNPFFFMNA